MRQYVPGKLELETSDKDDQAKERAQSAQEGYQASQDTLMSDFVSWAYN